MKPITIEWVNKAEADSATAERELRVKNRPNYDAVCFHSQQCAEKYLKARLQEADTLFPRIHDLSVLLDLALPIEPTWETLRDDLDALTAFAVEYRYPGESAIESEARESVEACRRLRCIVRKALHLALDEVTDEQASGDE